MGLPKSCKCNILPAFGGSRKRKGKRSAQRRAKKMHKKRNKSNKRYVSSHWSPSSSRFPSPQSPAYTRKRSPAHQLRDFAEDMVRRHPVK